MSKRVKPLLRLLFSLGLLVGILYFTDTRAVFSRFESAVPLCLIIAFLVGAFANQVVSPLKWLMLLKVIHPRARFREAFFLYAASSYYSLFLPGAVSGDVVRFMDMPKECGPRSKIFVSVLMDRVSGLWVMSLLGLAAVISSFFTHDPLPARPAIIVLFSLSLFACSLVLFCPLPEFLTRWIAKTRFTALIQSLKEAHDLYIRHKRSFWTALLFSLVFYILAGFACSFGAWALRLPLTFLQIFTIMTILSVVAFLPITYRGLGLNEAFTGAYFSALPGLDPADGISFSLLVFSITFTIQLLCGPLDAYYRVHHVKESFSNGD